ncbi:MAG TPA: hypothetical protein VGB49_02280, partial [Caulobacteraceae bacterium]
MTEAVTTTPFAAAASMRRKGLPWRFGIAALGYLVFSPVVGAHTALAWCLVYCAVQFVELLAFRPINSGAVTSPGPLRLAACTATLVLNTAVFTAIAGPLWLQGGYAGGICAILLMASGSIHSAAHAHSSRLVMAATVGPQFVGIGLTPLFMIGLGAAPAVVATGAVSALAFMAYAVTNWLALKGVRDAERAARIQSDRKRAESEAAMASKSA